MSPLLESWFFGGDMRLWISNDMGIQFDQRNALIVGLAMGFAVIPNIYSIAEDAVFSVPRSLTLGSLALGATPWQTLTRVVILTASPGIFSLLLLTPIGILLAGFLWTRLPASLRLRVPDGWEAAILIPVVLLVGWLPWA